jgi:Sodium:sulfate symporter transmembrane region
VHAALRQDSQSSYDHIGITSQSACRWCAGIAGQLNALGVIGHFANVVGGKLTTMNLGWPAVAALLSVAYYGLHYMFASQTAHVGALYSAFLAMMLSAGGRLWQMHPRPRSLPGLSVYSMLM